MGGVLLRRARGLEEERRLGREGEGGGVVAVVQARQCRGAALRLRWRPRRPARSAIFVLAGGWVCGVLFCGGRRVYWFVTLCVGGGFWL